MDEEQFDRLVEVVEREFGTDINTPETSVAAGLLSIAEALDRVAGELKRLGTNGASTPMGALEVVALEVKDGFEDLSSHVSEGFELLAGIVDRLTPG